MKLDILNIKDFIKANNLQPITDPIAISPTKLPTSGGIFSYDIFGYTSEDRKNTFAYIPLNGHFFHPQCVKALSRLGRYGDILNSNKYAVVINHIIKIVDKNEKGAKTGLDFYYDNWDDIDWKKQLTTLDDSDDVSEEDASYDKRTRFNFLNLLKKSDAFVEEWLVLPPYYRDMNSDDTSLGSDINEVYTKLISYTKSLRSDFGYSSFGDLTKQSIQNTLMILYNMTLTPLTGKTVDIKNNNELKGVTKNSMIRKNLIGRYVDFSALSVITSPLSSTTQTEKDFVKYGTCNLPLQSIVAMAKPFFMHYCQEFLQNYGDGLKSAANIKSVDNTLWSSDNIDRILTRFIKTGYDASLPIKFICTDIENNVEPLTLRIRERPHGSTNPKDIVFRYFTYIDMIYIAAIDICADKYTMNTRYPVANNQNIYCAKVVVVSTNRTHDVDISIGANGAAVFSEWKHYERYPFVKWTSCDNVKNTDIKPNFYYDLYRVTVVGNGVIKSLNADYDGDTMQFRMIFTKEANAEAEKLVWNKTNFFNANGKLTRGITGVGKDCVLSLYAWTKD